MDDDSRDAFLAMVETLKNDYKSLYDDCDPKAQAYLRKQNVGAFVWLMNDGLEKDDLAQVGMGALALADIVGQLRSNKERASFRLLASGLLSYIQERDKRCRPKEGATAPPSDSVIRKWVSMHKQGKPFLDIARKVGKDRGTISKYVRATCDCPDCQKRRNVR